MPIEKQSRVQGPEREVGQMEASTPGGGLQNAGVGVEPSQITGVSLENCRFWRGPDTTCLDVSIPSLSGTVAYHGERMLSSKY